MELLVPTESYQRGRPDSPVSEEGPTNVLLVEDTEDNRVMLRRLLEMSGYRVSVATNGAEAVQKAEHVSPQVILMDLSLPVIDGLAATRRIREVSRLKDVPIIAVSAHDTMDFHAEALAAGCDAYITKPIDYDELQGLIEHMLGMYKKKRPTLKSTL